MAITLILLVAIGGFGAVATINAVRNDGYGRIPTRRP